MPHALPTITVELRSQAKPWWRSKVIWFNVCVAMLAAAEASVGILQPMLPGNVYGWLVMVLAVGNAALRVITSIAIQGMQPPPLPQASQSPFEGQHQSPTEGQPL